MSPRKKVAAAWHDRVGLPPHSVWVGEREGVGSIVYLRWMQEKKLTWKSLTFRLRDERGAILPERQQMAYQAAADQAAVLDGRRVVAPAVTQRPTVTLGATWEILTDPRTGAYPTDTKNRREIKHALTHAVRVLGAGFPWVQFDSARLREVVRAKVNTTRARGVPGLRSAEVIGARLLTVLARLITDGHVPESTQIPGGRRWKQELREYVAALSGGRLPAVKRPRHTLEEMRMILKHADDVDPRFSLLLWVGMELRLGQVCRCLRSDLTLTGIPHAPLGALRVAGAGKKKGALVVFTPGMREAVDRSLTGYLAPLERLYAAGMIADYPLFPQGKLKDGQVSLDQGALRRDASVEGSAVRFWFRQAERRAGIETVTGRGFYGLRRLAVDEVTRDGTLSIGGLKELGGWSTETTPRGVYRDQEALEDAQEASVAKARLRGEPLPNL